MFAASVLIFAGCGPERREAAPPLPGGSAPTGSASSAPLETRVLARHDSLMALSGDLFVLRGRLTAGRGAAVAARAPHLVARLDSATRATLRADDAMTDWMHAYHRPAPGTAPDSATAYYRRQLRVLATVDLLTHRALDSASAVLRALPVAPVVPVAPATPVSSSSR